LYRGELVYTFLYDVGGEVRLSDAARLLRSIDTLQSVEPSKSAPSYVELGRPLSFRYAERLLETDKGPLRANLQARIYPIGGLTVAIRIPFEFPDLASVNDLTYLRPKDGRTMEALAREVQEQLRDAIRPALVEEYNAVVEPETYLVVVLTETDKPAKDLFLTERRMLAGIVAGEKRPERLSQEEVDDNVSYWYRYYDDDLVIVDWERSLVVEPSGKYDDVLTVMEVANLELLELRVYDKYLDNVLEASYDDLTRFYGRGGMFRSARHVQEELSNARIDLVRVTDAINNIGKIFGDYYLAKLHLGLAERFHLKEWETIVREKMATLNELYTLASHEVEHRRGVVLESMIVLLFIIDLVLIFLLSV
jgi:hypothetical protein